MLWQELEKVGGTEALEKEIQRRTNQSKVWWWSVPVWLNPSCSVLIIVNYKNGLVLLSFGE